MPINAKEAVLETITNQINENNPQEVKSTLDRLISEGNSKQEAIELIGCALTAEMFEMLKRNQPFNVSRYISYLKKLPLMPWD